MTDDQIFAWAFYEEEYKQAMELVAEISEFQSLPAEKPSELAIKKKHLASARSRLDDIIKGLTADPSVPRQMIDEVRRCSDAAELVGPPAESQSLCAPPVGPSTPPAVFVQIQLSCVQANQEPAAKSVSSAQAKVEHPLPSEPTPGPAPTASVQVELDPIEEPGLTVAHAVPIPGPVPATVAQMEQQLATAELVESVQADLATTRKTRRDLMTPAIEAAQRECQASHDAAEVWNVLARMCEEGRKPMIGKTEEGIQWVDESDELCLLSLKALRDRLRRSRDRLARAR